jgi:tetratricopeptide (TPR) repeat protein
MQKSEFATLCTALASHGSAVGAIKGVTLLLAVISEKLNKIETIVTKLQQEPYESGVIYLRNAACAEDNQRKLEQIEKAGDKFVSAVTLNDGRMKSRANFNAGCCYDLRGCPEIALEHYEDAFRVALKFEEEGQKKLASNASAVNKVRKGSATTAGVMGVAGAGLTYVVATTLGVAGISIALPAAAVGTAVVIGGLVAGAPGFTIAQLSGRVGKLFVGKTEQELDEFYYYFTQPLAILIIERGCNKELIVAAKNIGQGMRPAGA